MVPSLPEPPALPAPFGCLTPLSPTESSNASVRTSYFPIEPLEAPCRARCRRDRSPPGRCQAWCHFPRVSAWWLANVCSGSGGGRGPGAEMGDGGRALTQRTSGGQQHDPTLSSGLVCPRSRARLPPKARLPQQLLPHSGLIMWGPKARWPHTRPEPQGLRLEALTSRPSGPTCDGDLGSSRAPLCLPEGVGETQTGLPGTAADAATMKSPPSGHGGALSVLHGGTMSTGGVP